MAATVNKVFLLGNLGDDPETRHTAAGTTVTEISMCTTDTWRDGQGEKKEKPQWHKVVFFGKLAEIAAEYLRKGSKVHIEGSIDYQSWDGNDGQRKYKTAIKASSMSMLGGGQKGRTQRQAAKAQQQDSEPTTDGGDMFDDDIPF